MKKLSLVIAALLMFTVAMWAQGSGGGSGSAGSGQSGASSGTSGQAGAQSGGSSAGSQGAGQSDQSGSYNNQTGQTSGDQAKAKGEKTVEGCIVSAGTEFFLQPKHGKMIRLNDQGADLQAHVNHRVKVHGAEQRAGMSGNGTAASNPSASSSQTAASNPSSATNPDQTTAGNQPGAQSGNLPQSGASSSNMSVDRKNVSNKEITVSRVDMVSETCPADWMNKGNKSDKNKSNNGSSDMNNPH